MPRVRSKFEMSRSKRRDIERQQRWFKDDIIQPLDTNGKKNPKFLKRFGEPEDIKLKRK
jgi:hypothetical protein|tara:strand:- start:548 stop:724 length:177 start_codon:yes stop_codon:yes gene_type:complete